MQAEFDLQRFQQEINNEVLALTDTDTSEISIELQFRDVFQPTYVAGAVIGSVISPITIIGGFIGGVVGAALFIKKEAAKEIKDYIVKEWRERLDILWRETESKRSKSSVQKWLDEIESQWRKNWVDFELKTRSEVKWTDNDWQELRQRIEDEWKEWKKWRKWQTKAQLQRELSLLAPDANTKNSNIRLLLT